MAYIAEPLDLIIYLQLELGKGQGFRQALTKALSQSQTPFAEEVTNWLISQKEGQKQARQGKNMVRNQFFCLLEMGLVGAPILEQLKAFEEHMKEICAEDVELHIDKLPTLLSLPLVFCFLPAYLLLIVGPVLGALSISEANL
ncbi:MAG: hypothetical protein HRT45_03095 [Bdellovibrionales bacterium]|nr:hypothetical protein [Bdellovibrionales bacterium]